MKNLKNLGVIHDQNYSLFPFGAILNEDDQNEGTPVVREVYNDILSNFYALIQNRGLTFNNKEDNEVNGYQILSALSLVFNDLSDSYQILQKNQQGRFINIDFSITPQRLVLFVKSTDFMNLNAEESLFDKNNSEVKFKSKTKINSGDDCILFIDGDQSRLYRLNPESISESSLKSFPIFGSPLKYASGDNLWYFQDGFLSSMNLIFKDISNLIRIFTDNEFEIIKDIVESEGRFIVLTYNPNNYRYRLFLIYGDLIDQIKELEDSSFLISENPISDLKIKMYFDGECIYLSNQAGNSDLDNKISCFSFDGDSIMYIGEYILNKSFKKNNNTVIKNDSFIYLNGSGFHQFTFSGGYSLKETYNQIIGQIFRFGKDTFYCNSNNAHRIEL